MYIYIYVYIHTYIRIWNVYFFHTSLFIEVHCHRFGMAQMQTPTCTHERAHALMHALMHSRRGTHSHTYT